MNDSRTPPDESTIERVTRALVFFDHQQAWQTDSPQMPPPGDTQWGMWREFARVAILAFLGDTEKNGHRYLSTSCHHGDHDYCQNDKGSNGAVSWYKMPSECKFCSSKCICPCHEDDSVPAARTEETPELPPEQEFAEVDVTEGDFDRMVSEAEPVEITAYRDRIAAATRGHYFSRNYDEADADGNMPCVCGDWREPGPMGTDEEDWDSHLADVALAVLRPELDELADHAHRDQISAVSCGLTIPGIGDRLLGPCVRLPHRDPVHRSADGVRWWPNDGHVTAFGTWMTDEEIAAFLAEWSKNAGKAIRIITTSHKEPTT